MTKRITSLLRRLPYQGGWNKVDLRGFRNSTLRTAGGGLREGMPPTEGTKDKDYDQESMIGEVSEVLKVWIDREANLANPFVLKGKLGHWKGSCLRLLPNIRKQAVTVIEVVDMLKEMFDVSWKRRTISLWGWRSRKRNKYLMAMYKRLESARKQRDLFEGILTPTGELNKIDEPREANNQYWNLAYFLMTHSTVFQVLHANKVLSKERTWPGTVPLSKVLGSMKKVQERLIKGDWMEVQVRRVWIDGDKRPLGVPTLADRIIGSMLSNLLEYYLWDTIVYNHGYQTNRGSGSAWKKILSELISYPYIWEYDLDGCFNRLNHRAMVQILRGIQLPSWLWISLLRIQKKAPSIDAESGGYSQRTTIGKRMMELQSGTKKKFIFWDAQNKEGVAQGHSLSPLISVIMIEHCVRSWMKKSIMSGNETIGYADDGLYFTMWEFPVEEYKRHIRNWGMFLSEGKCGEVRSAYIWKKTLKFLGLLYNPFLEKFQANTRKGSKVILETSKGLLYKDGKLIGTEEGVFYREGPYSKLGEWVKFRKELANEELTRLLAGLVISIIHPWLALIVGLYWVNLGYIVWWYYITMLGVHQLFDTDGLLTLLLWIGVMTTGIGLPNMEYEVVEGERQQITWRLVLKANKLNAFIARLYNKQLADLVIPQDFRLRKDKGSLLWYMSNHETVEEMLSQGKAASQTEGKTLLERISEDMEEPINFANSSTVGTYFLIEYLTRGKPTVKGPPTPKQLKRKLLSKFHLGGYWWINHIEAPQEYLPPRLESANVPIVNGPQLLEQGLVRLLSVNSSDGKSTKPGAGPAQIPVWIGPVKLSPNLEREEYAVPIHLLGVVDWGYLLTTSWLSGVKQNRHRWCSPWPASPDDEGKIIARRIYRQYRLWLSRGAKGFVPIIRKRRTCGEPRPPAQNHKAAINVPRGGVTVYSEKNKFLKS